MVPGGDLLPHDWGTGRLSLRLDCFGLLLGFPHDSPAADEVNYDQEQLRT